MNSKKISFLLNVVLIISTLMLSGCPGVTGGNEDPAAVIKIAATTADAGDELFFDASDSSDSDGSISEYSWNFGDGSSLETDESVSHAFSTAGSYTVELIVTDNDGAEDSASVIMTIISPAVLNTAPVADIQTSSTTVKTGTSLEFDGSGSYDSDGSISSYSWDFGDGNTSSLGPLVSHVYSSAGSYTAVLTVEDDDGYTDDFEIEITVVDNLLPSASFTTSDCSVQIGDAINLDASASEDPDGTIVSYDWDFGDGNYDTGETLSHTYTAAGGYTVILTVADDAGGTDIEMISITVSDGTYDPPSANAGDDQDVDLDSVSEVVLDASGSSASSGHSISSYLWTFYSKPDGSTLTNSDITDSTNVIAGFDIADEECSHDDNGDFVYIMKLLVTDDTSVSSTDYMTVTATGSSIVTVIIY